MLNNIANTIRYDRAQQTNPQIRPPLRLPRNKTSCMLLMQQLAVRGHAYWTSGIISEAKVGGFVSKMDTRFHVLEPAKSRNRMRQTGTPTGHLILYRQQDTDLYYWWVLVAGREAAVEKLAAEYRETLHPIHHRPAALTWGDEYVMRPGPRSSLTWWLQRRAANDVEAELRYCASAHGQSWERVDDLVRAVARARYRPMFAGVRLQVKRSIARSVRAWNKTHSPGVEYPADNSQLPWCKAGMRIYDKPPAIVIPAG